MNQKDLPKDLPITIDPEIHSGTPVFRGTRVPVETLFVNLADGYSLDEIIAEFPTIKRQDAVKVLQAVPYILVSLQPA